MEKFLRKIREFEEKWEHKVKTEVSAHTYDWYRINQYELFCDVWELNKLYEETDDCRRRIKKHCDERAKHLANVRDLEWI